MMAAEIVGIAAVLAAGAIFAGPMHWGSRQTGTLVLSAYGLLSLGVTAIVL